MHLVPVEALLVLLRVSDEPSNMLVSVCNGQKKDDKKPPISSHHLSPVTLLCPSHLDALCHLRLMRQMK